MEADLFLEIASDETRLRCGWLFLSIVAAGVGIQLRDVLRTDRVSLIANLSSLRYCRETSSYLYISSRLKAVGKGSLETF